MECTTSAVRSLGFGLDAPDDPSHKQQICNTYSLNSVGNLSRFLCATMDGGSYHPAILSGLGAIRHTIVVFACYSAAELPLNLEGTPPGTALVSG